MESRAKLAKGLSGRYTSRPASAVKGHWRDIVDEVNAVGEVVVTNYDRPEVVVMSIDRYTKLREEAVGHDPLTTLRAEFDRELSVLREANAARRLQKVFASSPAEVARAANAASRRRKH